MATVETRRTYRVRVLGHREYTKTFTRKPDAEIWANAQRSEGSTPAIEERRTYRARVRIFGHPERTATFIRKTDARDWAQQLETDLKRGRYVPTTEAMRRTVAQMIDRYLDETLPFKGRNRDSKGTIRYLRFRSVSNCWAQSRAAWPALVGSGPKQ